jgi:hypothetical protein
MIVSGDGIVTGGQNEDCDKGERTSEGVPRQSRPKDPLWDDTESSPVLSMGQLWRFRID